VALDARVDLDRAVECLEWDVVRRTSYGLALRGPEGQSLYVFEFGALVADERAAERFESLASSLDRRLLPDTREAWLIGIDAMIGPDGPRAGWDRVVVSEGTPERLAAIALLIGQSAALERHELAVDRLLEEVGRVTDELARGRSPRRSRKMVARIGHINSSRLELARWFFLVSRPDEAWEHPEVASLYDALFRNLELEERHRAVLHKLAVAGEGLETTVDLWHARWNHWLEWAIVILIVVDIVLALEAWF
jgi:hypothetical protein